jgi:hypothetical protein
MVRMNFFGILNFQVSGLANVHLRWFRALGDDCIYIMERIV